MKASMRTVPIASKKLFVGGRDDASDVRTEPAMLDPTGPQPAATEAVVPPATLPETWDGGAM